MPYSIHKTDSDIIRVTYSGKVDLDDRKMAVDEACQSIQSADHVRLLIDVRDITSNIPASSQKEFAQYLAAKETLKNAKVAVLHKHENNPNLLINAYAYAEGYVTVSFNNEYDAILWLDGEIN